MEPCFKPLQLDPGNSSPASESLPDLEHANSLPLNPYQMWTLQTQTLPLFPQLYSVSSIIFSEKLCLCLFYCPPSSPVSTFDKLCTILHLLNPIQFSNFLIIGDFNVNFLDQKSYLFSYVRDVLDSFSFSQIVPFFTHVSPSGTKSLIDLALLLRTEHL